MVPRLGNSWETRTVVDCRMAVHILVAASRIPIPKWIENFEFVRIFLCLILVHRKAEIVSILLMKQTATFSLNLKIRR